MSAREPALTDDMRAAVALRHLDARDRARGNAAAYERERTTDLVFGDRGMLGIVYRTRARERGDWWRTKALEHEADARAILPPADGYDWPVPAFVGGT